MIRPRTETYAYLFSIGELTAASGDPYNVVPQRAVVGALADTSQLDSLLLARGDVLLSNVATSVAAVTSDGEQPRFGTAGPRTHHRLDLELYTTLVWDLCDAISGQPHDTDLDALAVALGRHDVFVIVASGIDDATATATSERAVDTTGYLGSVGVDLGNPVQRRIMLVPTFAYLLDGVLAVFPENGENLIQPRPIEEYPDPWWEGLPVAAVRWVTFDEVYGEGQRLPAWPTVGLSERGAQTAAILARRTKPTHMDRLAKAVAGRDDAGPWPFAVDTAALPGAADAIVEPEKLAGYALNPDHPAGRHKARLFRNLLGITAEDADFLAGQLKQGLLAAETLVRVRTDEWGVKYHVVVDVTGRNGAVRPVLAAWEVRQNAPPRLTTAYVADAGTPSDTVAERAVLDPSLTGDARWEALWTAADATGRAAAAACVPTPIKVAGEWMPSGLYGVASVTVPDARKGFARWLLRNGHARRYGRPGATVKGPGGSLDPSRAYATAFADVLALNGIEAKVSEVLM